jgi:hypothetical protein
MVDQLNGFSSEVTRVAREVGTEGKLGGLRGQLVRIETMAAALSDKAVQQLR